jgi:hypothetical protein
MRVASSRVATVAMVLVGLAALAVAGRLVRTAPSAEHSATSAAVTIPPAATATTLDSVEVPDAFGQRLAQAKMVMRAAGLRGGGRGSRSPGPWGGGCGAGAGRRHPGPTGQCGGVSDQDRRAGQRRGAPVAAGSWPDHHDLSGGCARSADPPAHDGRDLPRAAGVRVWLETEFKSRVPVVGRRQDPTSCKPAGGQVRCVVRLGAVNAGGELGIWTARVAKHSSPLAVMEVTVRFARH